MSTSIEVLCPPDRVRELLLDEAFLDAFVDQQHPHTKTIVVDRGAGRSTCSWNVRLTGQLPRIVTVFVGRSADIDLVFDVAGQALALDAKANRRGALRRSFEILPGANGGSHLTLEGDVEVSGALGGQAENAVRDQVLLPVLTDDLAPLLQDWCHGPPRS